MLKKHKIIVRYVIKENILLKKIYFNIPIFIDYDLGFLVDCTFHSNSGIIKSKGSSLI